MKKIGTIVILYTITIVFVLFLGYHFKNLMLEYCSEIEASFLASLIFKGLLIILSIYLLKKLNLFIYLGLDKPFKMNNPTALIAPSVIIGLTIFSKLNLYLAISTSNLFIFLFSVILTGVFEEISMRGILLPLFVKLFSYKKKSFYLAAIFSSLIFGTLHYLNIYMREDYGFDIATSQVIFAFCIGIYFCGLFFRTGSIITSILIHSAINFGFGTTSLEKIRDGYTPPIGREIDSFTELLPTLILYLIIITIGLLMIKFSNQESFIKKLKLQ